MRTVFPLLILLILSFPMYAQTAGDSTPNSSNIKSKFEQFRSVQDKSGLDKDTLLLQLRQLSNERFKTEIALERSRQRELEDENYAMHHRWRSFDFQYRASIIIFILVIVIVLCGLVFSAWQFRLAMKQMRVKETVAKAVGQSADSFPQLPAEQQATESPAMKALKNEMEVSAAGIKVNSSVLGVIILVLSIVFFYFYLLYVYPIKYIPAGVPTKADSVSVSSGTWEQKSRLIYLQRPYRSKLAV